MEQDKSSQQFSEPDGDNTNDETLTSAAAQDAPEAAAEETAAQETPEAAAEETAAGKAESPSIPGGKIFADSLNVYDDEAKVAFEYFRKAAEKIIAEEDRITARQKELKLVIEEAEQERKRGIMMMIFLFWLLLIPLFIGLAKKNKAEKTIRESQEELAELDRQFKAIKRDYTISKLGVAYVPIATEVPFDGKSFILDDTSQTPKKEFKLSQIGEYENFMATIKNLQDLKAATPITESGETPEEIPASHLVPSFDNVTLNDHLGKIDRDLRSTTYFLNNVIHDSVSLPIVPPKSEYTKFLDEYCVAATGGAPTLNIFDNSAYSDDLKHFDEINEMQKKLSSGKIQLDSFLEDFIVELGEYIQIVSRTKIASISKLLASGGETLLNTFNASYNHYSMEIAQEEIERLKQEDFDFNEAESPKPFILSPGSRMHYDAVSENWLADDGSRSTTPLGIHQIQEEIISPLVQNLLRETRIERLKIYNDIINQKINYIKEWQKEVDDFYGRGRAEGNNIITQLQVTLGEFTTAYNQYMAFLKTEKSMFGDGDEDNKLEDDDASLQQVMAFREQADAIEEKKNEFNRYVERLQDEIERRAAEFKYTCDYEAMLRDGNSKSVVTAIDNADNLDSRRKTLLAANAYIATGAKLPPEPTVNDALYEKMATDLNLVASEMLTEIDSVLNAPEEEETAPADADEADAEETVEGADVETAEAGEDAENAGEETPDEDDEEGDEEGGEDASESEEEESEDEEEETEAEEEDSDGDAETAGNEDEQEDADGDAEAGEADGEETAEEEEDGGEEEDSVEAMFAKIDDPRISIGGNIDEDLLNNAIEAFAGDADPEDAFALIDDTDDGDATAGCLITNEAIFVNDVNGEAQYELPGELEWDVKTSDDGNELLLNGETVFTFTHPSVDAMKAFADALNALVAANADGDEDDDDDDEDDEEN